MIAFYLISVMVALCPTSIMGEHRKETSVPLCDPEKAYSIKLLKGSTGLNVIPKRALSFSYEIAPSSVRYNILKYRHYRSLCVASLNLSPGDKCTSKVSFYGNFTTEELEEMKKKVACKTFLTCPPGKCTGDGSSECSSGVKTSEVSPRKMEYEGMSNSEWLHDSCVQDTECGFNKGTGRLSWSNIGDELRLDFSEEKSIVSKGLNFRHSFSTPSSYEYYFLNQTIQLASGRINATCFKDNEEYACISNSDLSENYQKGFVFRMPVGSKFWIDGPVKLLTLENSPIESHPDLPKTRYYEGATLLDLMRTVNNVEFDQLQSEYNSLALLKTIEQTQEIVLKILNELGRRDSHLIPGLLNIGGLARRLKEDEYLITPCLKTLDADGADEADLDLMVNPETGLLSTTPTGMRGIKPLKDWFGLNKEIRIFNKTELSLERSVMPKLSTALKFVKSDPQIFFDSTGLSSSVSWASIRGTFTPTVRGFEYYIGEFFQRLTVFVAWASFSLWIIVITLSVLKFVI